MGKIIYYQEFSSPKVFYDPVLKIDREIIGEYVCTDDRVEHFSIVGSMGAKKDSPMKVSGELVLKNGERKSFQVDEIDNKVEEKIIEQAEEYLTQLK